MKESRAEAETGSNPLAIADQNTNILERVAMALVAFDIGEKRAIVAVSNSREMRRKIFHERTGFPECFAVLLVGKERKTRLLQKRRFGRQRPGILVRGGKLARLILARLDIRLVERIDAQDGAGNGGGDLQRKNSWPSW